MIKQRSELPHLPPDMIAQVYQSLEERRNINTHSGEDPKFVYEYMAATPKLVEWLHANIDKNADWAVQYFTGKITAHTDWIFDDHKLNYLVDLGGNDIKTHWFDADGNVIHTAVCTLGWYELTVNVPHTVEHVPGWRISVTHNSKLEKLAARAGLVPDQRDSVKDYGFKT